MIKIRLKQVGRKKNHQYRIIVARDKTKRDGKYIDDLGYFNPVTKELNFNINKFYSYIKKGASPTSSVRGLLIKSLKK